MQIDPNWAASWDPTNQAHYYYHTITGLTQWEPPEGFDTTSIQQQQAEADALPDELARELARDVSHCRHHAWPHADVAVLQDSKPCMCGT